MPSPLENLAVALQPGLQAWAQRGYEEDRKRKIARLLGNTFAQPDGGGQGDPVAALAALSGKNAPAAPAAAAPAPGAPPPFRPGVPPAAGQPDPLAPLPAAPPRPSAAPPGAPTGEAGADAPTGMAVAPGMADPFKEGQSIIKNLWQTIQSRNPKADPLTIMEAVESQLDEIKGVAPITKATMQGQIAYMRAQTDQQYKMQRLQQYDHDFIVKMMNATTAEERQRATESYQKGRLAIEQERATTYEEATTYTHEDREASTAGRLDIAKLGAANRMSIAELKEMGLSDRAAAALKGRNGAALVGALGKIQASGQQVDASTLSTLIDALSSGGSTQSSKASAPASTSSGGPKVGTKKGGYTYVGGDPSKPSSWKKD